MTNDARFEIKLIQKVPYLSSFLSTVLVALAFVLLVFYFFFIPSDGSSLEMKSVYYLITVPEFWKKVSIFSALGIIVVYPLYLFIRTYKAAFIKFSSKEVIIDHVGVIAIDSISNFQIYEAAIGDAFTVRINKSDGSFLIFKLRYPVQADELIQIALLHQIDIDESPTKGRILSD
jgi:hypothetical protein